jgi:hypothetical protein
MEANLVQMAEYFKALGEPNRAGQNRSGRIDESGI